MEHHYIDLVFEKQNTAFQNIQKTRISKERKVNLGTRSPHRLADRDYRLIATNFELKLHIII